MGRRTLTRRSKHENRWTSPIFSHAWINLWTIYSLPLSQITHRTTTRHFVTGRKLRLGWRRVVAEEDGCRRGVVLFYPWAYIAAAGTWAECSVVKWVSVCLRESAVRIIIRCGNIGAALSACKLKTLWESDSELMRRYTVAYMTLTIFGQALQTRICGYIFKVHLGFVPAFSICLSGGRSGGSTYSGMPCRLASGVCIGHFVCNLLAQIRWYLCPGLEGCGYSGEHIGHNWPEISRFRYLTWDEKVRRRVGPKSGLWCTSFCYRRTPNSNK